jgi:hypothetical protein
MVKVLSSQIDVLCAMDILKVIQNIETFRLLDLALKFSQEISSKLLIKMDYSLIFDKKNNDRDHFADP